MNSVWVDVKFRRDRWHGPYPYTDDGILQFKNHMEGPLAGCYAIHLKRAKILYPFKRHSLIYIGKAKDIDIRLSDHLRETDPNESLWNYLHNRQCIFYIRHCNMNGARSYEREFIEWCLDTLGCKPVCNSQM